MTPRLVLFSIAVLLIPGSAGHSQSRRDHTSRLAAFRTDRDFSEYIRRFAIQQDRARRQAIARSHLAGGCGSAKIGSKVWKRKMANPQTAPAVITGKVISLGSQMGGVSVSATNLALGTTTSGDGRYSVQLPADRLGKDLKVRLLARRLGLEPSEKTLTVAPGDSIELDFVLCSATVQLSSVVTGAATDSYAANSESITNVQHEGVDEGGIVKMHGNHLVVLRRGRLFTVSLADGRLRAVAALDAFGPGLDPRAAWYDELLMYGDKAVVIGYSYDRGGTEIGLFHIDAGGALTYLSTYQLRSNDYYSSRNYASRLIGSKLVFYTPLGIAPGTNALEQLPSMRKWRAGAPADSFERITPAPRIYKPARALDPTGEVALHTVTACDLATAELRCDATALLGPPGRVFYVSSRATYVWVTERRVDRNGSRQGMLYRMPLDGTAPSALGVTGSPVDQFSFLESDDDHLNVLVLSGARGEMMWRSERAKGDASLLRVAIGSFGDGTRSAESSSYRPVPSDSNGVFHNRFVADHLLYGVGNGWGGPHGGTSTLYVVPWKGGRILALPLSHRVDRIEPMGRDAVIVGSDSARLHFDGVSLSASPHLAQHFVLDNAAQGELRSHGFFYKPDGRESGVLGLPVRSGGQRGSSHLRDGSASILFLHNVDERFQELGELEAGAHAGNDGCKASCVDWYGNARPIFAGGRVFALLGYELVEGRVGANAITEVGRVNFAPRLDVGVGK